MGERAWGLWSPQRQLLGRGWNRHPFSHSSFRSDFLSSSLPLLWALGCSNSLRTLDLTFLDSWWKRGLGENIYHLGALGIRVYFIHPTAPKHPSVCCFSLQEWRERLGRDSSPKFMWCSGLETVPLNFKSFLGHPPSGGV